MKNIERQIRQGTISRSLAFGGLEIIWKVFLAGSSDQLAFAWNCESKLDNNYEFVYKRKS